MKVLFTHPGTQYSLALVAQLQKQGLLYKYCTGLVFTDDPADKWRRWWNGWGLRRWTSKRTVSGIPVSKMHRQAGLELLSVIRHQWFKQSNDRVFGYRNRLFQQRVPQRFIEEADVIIGFDTCSRILAERARQAGKPFVLDASIAHPLAKESIYASLRRRYPLWQQGMAPKAPALIAGELREMELATHIVVASGYTRQTYLDHGVDPANISINPYGINPMEFRSKWETGTHTGHRAGVRFCFLGSTSARKGLPWLLEIWPAFQSRHPEATLSVAGYFDLPAGFSLPAGVSFVGALHPTERADWLRSHDVFVFPSFFEGFAQVIIEAMACGLPVITTTHTCGPEVIEEGREGWCVSPGDDAAILNHMHWLFDHPASIEPMGRASRQKALQYTWDAYGDRWLCILKHHFGSS
jgi:glycosyltransferase involved in cell wall biosynthesis